MNSKREILVIGTATDADRGSWVVDVTGSVYVRASSIRAFTVADPGTVTHDGEFAIVAILSTGDDEYVVVAEGLTREQAQNELAVKLS